MHEEDIKGKLKQDAEYQPAQDSSPAEISAPKVIENADKIECAGEPFDSSSADAKDFAGLVSDIEELPALESVTSVVLMPVEPDLAHVYWQVSPDRLEEGQAVVRFQDVTGSIPQEGNEQAQLEIGIDLPSGSAYVRSLSPGGSYVAELGFKSRDMTFIRKAQSQIATMPVASPLPKGGLSFMLVSPESEVAEYLPHPSSIASDQILELSPVRNFDGISLRGRDQGRHASGRPPAPGWGMPSGSLSFDEGSSDWESMEIERSRAIDLLEFQARGLRDSFDFADLYPLSPEAEPPFSDARCPAPESDLTERSEKSFTSGDVVSS